MQTLNFHPNCDLLGPEDVEDVMRLEGLCFRTRWSREQFLLGLARGAFRIIGWRERGALLAYVAFSVIAGEMEILNIGTHPFHRRKGMGRALLEEVFAICRAEGVEEGFLEVRRSNATAIDLYEKFGFIKVGTRKNYYPDNNEDALLYRVDMTPGAALADNTSRDPHGPDSGA